MTPALAATAHPAEPPSIAEWEDLLVRLEILPRALRVTLEEAPAGEERVHRALAAALEREVELSRWLALASGESAAERTDVPAGAAAMADRIASLRARSFAMLQRRGLEVWAWTAPAEGGVATAYQMVTALVQADAETLAALREGRHLGSPA